MTGSEVAVNGSQRTNVMVVGGGFAGVACAKVLAGEWPAQRSSWSMLAMPYWRRSPTRRTTTRPSSGNGAA
jgi:hypothetical protein